MAQRVGRSAAYLRELRQRFGLGEFKGKKSKGEYSKETLEHKAAHKAFRKARRAPRQSTQSFSW